MDCSGKGNRIIPYLKDEVVNLQFSPKLPDAQKRVPPFYSSRQIRSEPFLPELQFSHWFSVKPLEGEEEGTDRWAFGRNFVSITPLRLDLTDEKDLARVLALPVTPPRKAPAKSRKRN